MFFEKYIFLYEAATLSLVMVVTGFLWSQATKAEQILRGPKLVDIGRFLFGTAYRAFFRGLNEQIFEVVAALLGSVNRSFPKFRRTTVVTLFAFLFSLLAVTVGADLIGKVTDLVVALGGEFVVGSVLLQFFANLALTLIALLSFNAVVDYLAFTKSLALAEGFMMKRRRFGMILYIISDLFSTVLIVFLAIALFMSFLSVGLSMELLHGITDDAAAKMDIVGQLILLPVLLSTFSITVLVTGFTTVFVLIHSISKIELFRWLIRKYCDVELKPLRTAVVVGNAVILILVLLSLMGARMIAYAGAPS